MYTLEKKMTKGYFQVTTGWRKYAGLTAGKGTCAYTNSNFVQQCSADAMNAQVLIARMALAAYLRQTGGLSGHLMAQSATWNKNWKDKDGFPIKILLIDLTQATDLMSHGDLLTRNQVRKLLGDREVDDSMREMPFEEVVKLIEAYNAR